MEFLQLMANSGLKSCFTTITILLVIINHKHVGVCQSLCLTGTYLGTLSDGSKDCLFCRDNCEIGYEKVEDCKAESDIKCRKCSSGTFYNGKDMTCKNCTKCHGEIKKNCTLSTDTVCYDNTTAADATNEEESSSLRIVSIAAVFGATSVLVIGIIVGLTYWYMRKRRKNKPISLTMENKSHTEEADAVNQSLIEQVSPAAQTSNTVEHSTPENEDGVKNHEVTGCEEVKGSVVTKSSVHAPPNSNNSNPFSTKNVILQLVSYSGTNDFTLSNPQTVG